MGTNPVVAVGIGENLYKGVNVKITLEGSSDEAALFLVGQGDIVGMSPWAVAQFNSEGQDFRFLTTAGGIIMINGLAIRTQDAGKYKTIQDLKGKKLAITGMDSDTWLAFSALMKTDYGIDAAKDFQLVTSGSGTLLALLSQGQVDAALLFSGQTATARALPDQYTLLLGLTDIWQQKNGTPLDAVAPAARNSWLQKNPDAAKAFIQGTDCAVAWMSAHPEAFDKGGKYEAQSKLKGWFTNADATKAILALIKDGKYFSTSASYSQSFIDSNYELVKLVLGSGTTVPDKTTIFYPPVTP